jgi:hypothetical protein
MSSPAPVWQRCFWQDSQNLGRVDPPRAGGAQVGPVVAEVGHVGELLSRVQPRQLHSPIVFAELALDLPVWVRIVQPSAVGEDELLQVRAVPAGERVVGSVGELLKMCPLH